MKIDTHDRTVRDVLKGATYVIPRFQRAYSWEADQIEEFWEDTIQDRDGDYFIGPMVLYPEGRDSYGVVDGQQRLTTIAMLLCVLRDAFDAHGFGDKAEGTHGFVERTDEDNKRRFVLETDSSHPFLGAQILAREKAALGDVDAKEEQTLAAAHGRLVEYVDGVVRSVLDNTTLSEKKRADRLEGELTTVRDNVLNLVLIRVEVDGEDDAKKIFVTLNARGLDLTTGDLIKTHVLDRLPSASAKTDQPRLRWDKLVGLLDQAGGGLEIDRFLLASWQSRVEYVGQNKLYKSVRRTVKRPTAATGYGADDYLAWLETDAKAYAAALVPDGRRWESNETPARGSLRFLHEQRIRQPAPLLLALVRAYDGGKIKLRRLKRALQAVEHYHFSFTVVASKSSSGGMSGLYSRFARALLAADTSNKRSTVLDELEDDLRERLPTREEFAAGFKELWLPPGTSKERKAIKYALHKLYRAQAPAGAIPDVEQMTIEHLCPQSTLEDDLSDSVGRIGNLVLVPGSLNLDLGTKSFEKKRDLLAAADGLFVPPEVLSARDWDAETITERTEELAAVAYDTVWTI